MRLSSLTTWCLLFSTAASAQSFVLHNELGGFLDIGAPPKTGEPPPLLVQPFTGAESQLWTFDPVKGLSKNTFVIRSARKGGPVVEVLNPGARGAPPALTPFVDGTSAQRWMSQAARIPNFIELKSETGWFLDVPWHTFEPGLPVGTWSFNDFLTQHWQALASTPSTATEVGRRCPVAKSDPGDYGGSPFVTLKADASIDADGAKVSMHLSFTAERPMGTVLSHGSWDEVVFTAPASQRVLGIMPGSRHSEYSEWAPSAGFEFIGCNEGELLERHPTSGPVDTFFFIGDTGGVDFNTPGAAEFCDCDSQLSRVTFKPLELVLAPR